MALAWDSKFQSTHPRGVRPRANSRTLRPTDFNPRTHVGCDPSKAVSSTAFGISIHAPTWGATTCPAAPGRPWRNFNPRTHVGCDLDRTGARDVGQNFNPRTHVGCDGLFSRSSGDTRQFQSTHPRGVRLGAIFQGWSDPIFQSTHPRGVRRI